MKNINVIILLLLVNMDLYQYKMIYKKVEDFNLNIEVLIYFLIILICNKRLMKLRLLFKVLLCHWFKINCKYLLWSMEIQ